MSDGIVLSDIQRSNTVVKDTLVVGRRLVAPIVETNRLLVHEVLQLDDDARIVGFNIDGQNINSETVTTGTIKARHIQLTDSSDQMSFGQHNQVVFNVDLSVDQTITFPAVGNASVVMTEGNQDINGIKTFNDVVVFLGGFSLASLTLSDTSNQLTLGTGTQIILNAPAPVASHIYTMPDVGTNANFIMSEGNQTINGVKTFNDAVIFNVGFTLTNLTLSDVTNQLHLGTGNLVTLNAPTPAASRTHTIPDVANAFFVMTEGAQTINGVKTFSDMIVFLSGFTATNLTLSNVSNQLSLGTGNLITVNAPTPLASLTYTMQDVKANANFIMSEGNQTINGIKTFNDLVIFNVGFTLANLTLSDTSNQLTLGTGNQIILNAPTPGGTYTYTMPDVGGNASFVMTVGGQTIAGAKVFSTQLTVSPTTDQLVLGGAGPSNTVTITAPTPAASRTLTIPDPGANASFVMTAGTQTIGGAKTFSTAVTITPTSNQLTLGTAQTITVTAPTPAASRTYTIIDAGSAANFVMTNSLSTQQISGTIGSQTYRIYPGGFGSPFINISGTAAPGVNLNYRMPVAAGIDADFTMTEGDQTLNGIKTFSSGVPITAVTNQLVLGTGNTVTLTSPAPGGSRVYTIPDVLANAAFVMTEGNQTINGIKTFTTAPVFPSLSMASITLTNTTNQIIAGTGQTGTINITTPAASRIYTLSDPGSDAKFVMTEGPQTINNVKTFSSGIPITATSNQLILGGAGPSNTVTLTAPTPGANSVYTITDVGTSANFIMSAGTQTVGGAKTFTTAVTINPTSNQLVLGGVGPSNTITLTAPTPAGSRTYTIPDVLANADFIMSFGTQTVGGSKTFSSAVTISPTGNQIVLGSGNTITLNAATILYGAPRQYSFPEAGADCSFVMTAGSQTIGGAKTFSAATTFATAITITPTTNQITLGDTKTVTLTSVAPAASRTYTIPDAGGNATFVMAVSGTATFGAISLTNTTNQITLATAGNNLTVSTASQTGAATLTVPNLLGTNANFVVTDGAAVQSVNNTFQLIALKIFPGGFGGNSFQISGSNPAANRVYTLPDVLADASFVMTQGAQTINGNKTFGNNIILPTSGGTASNFNYYEELDTSFNLTSTTFTGNQSINVYYVRVGKSVTMTVSGFSKNADLAVSGTIVSGAGAIASQFRPVQDYNATAIVRNQSTDIVGNVTITTAGTMTWTCCGTSGVRLVIGGNFTGAGGNVGIFSTSYSWRVT